MQSALFPGLVLAVVAGVAGYRFYARRQAAKLKVSGGRMALVLNLVNRSR
jgi:hypothetical protein